MSMGQRRVRNGIRAAAAMTLAVFAAIRAPAAPPPRPKLIVVLAVDQFADDLYRHYRPTFTEGLGRLGQGVAFTGYQSHAATETCPGHSTILTGRHPAATGIVANTWYDPAARKSVYCVSVPGADAEARGPQNLRVDTLGDRLKAARPAARVVSISGKDRAAIMLGGRHADAVYWWGGAKGFTTSPYAGPAGPEVTGPADDFSNALLARWRAEPPKLWPDPSPACASLQRAHTFGQLTLSGRVPPDAAAGATAAPDFPARSDFQDQLRASPTYDAIVADFAIAAVDAKRLGRGPATDLLAVSFSATDYVGHRYGNGGAEMCVQMQALDRTIGRLLAHLDGLRVPYVVVLTADHGAGDAAERAREHGGSARRIDASGLVRSLNAELRTRFALAADPIVGPDTDSLWIDVDQALRPRVRDAAIAWLRQRPEVAAAFTAAEVAAAAPQRGRAVRGLTLAERFHESYDPQRSGDILVAYAEGATLGLPRKPGDNIAGHGSPWDYDRRVPMLFWWPGAKPDRRAEPAETVDISPTLSAVAGLPSGPTDGRCLLAVTRRCR